MPIEVKELVIKAVVGEKNKEVSTTALAKEEISKLKRNYQRRYGKSNPNASAKK
ncbi:MAG: hypothetical protein IPL53_19055 [Ignavibacteria bacterium]|nr:hypothetical protein [Ignavibacteria bacterium]